MAIERIEVVIHAWLDPIENAFTTFGIWATLPLARRLLFAGFLCTKRRRKCWGQSYNCPKGADSEEKHEPVNDIDTAVVDSLKVLDLKRPIREADIVPFSGLVIGAGFSRLQRSGDALRVARAGAGAAHLAR